MGAERSQWQFPANEVGKVIGWSDEASPSNPNASKGLVNKGPFVGTADVSSNPDLSVDPTELPTRDAVKTYADTLLEFDQALTGDHWSDIGDPRLHFQNDRVFIGLVPGDIWTGYNYSPGVTELSWIGDITPNLRYIEKGAQIAVFSKVGGPASLFASRRSDHDGLSTGPYTAGVGALVYNDVAGPPGVQTEITHPGSWASYKEAWRIQGAGPAIVQELESANLGDEPTFFTPYGALNASVATDIKNLAFGLGIGAGAGQGAEVTLHDSTAAIYVTGNGSKFRSGMIFIDGSLTDRGTNQFHAIEFARHHRQVWFYSLAVNAKQLQIYASGADASKQSIIEASATAFRIKTVREDLTTETNAGLAVIWPALAGSGDINGLAVQPAQSGANGSVTLTGAGTDPIVGIILAPKGAGSVFLRDSSANNRIQINGTGIGFFGTTPIAAPTGWGVPTGTLVRTTFVAYDGQTHTGSYVQATVQALDDAVRNVSRRVAALITDLHQTAGYGLLRT